MPGGLQGVLSGSYTGGERLVDAAKLPRAARQRLADVLTGDLAGVASAVTVPFHCETTRPDDGPS
jgi:hypothetical protein